jgi:putative DNA primase/helicase
MSAAPQPTPVMQASTPYQIAANYLRLHRYGTVAGLLFWRAEWFEYRDATWRTAPEIELRARLYEYLDAAKLQVRKRLVDEVLDALRALASVPDRWEPPLWLEAQAGDRDPGALLLFPNGVLDVNERTFMPRAPRLFAIGRLDFEYEDDPKPPARFFVFLDEIFGDDLQSRALLQQWLGYVLSRSLRQQKALGIIGPPRSGKGVIGHLVSGLIGADNAVSPGLSQFASPFGLQSLIGKSLAVISDARLSSRSDSAAILENLLRVTAGDPVVVDRKYGAPWTGILPTRIMLLANELFTIPDASTALASRFLVLQLRRSWLGAEDPELVRKLLEERAGILHWCLDGLAELRRAGRFAEPDASREIYQELRELSSPISAFLEDACVIGPDERVQVADLYAAWVEWCEARGRRPGEQQRFGTMLKAACPWLKNRRPRTDNPTRQRFYEGLRLRSPADQVTT